MDSEKWFNEFSDLVDGTIQSIEQDTDRVTGADIGLVLEIAEDYLDDPSENIGRNLRAVRMAQEILDLKYNTDELSWFDIYETVVEMNSKVGRIRNIEGKNLEADLDDLYNVENPKSQHTSEFQQSVQRLFESINSETAEELKSTYPYSKEHEVESFSHFHYAVRREVGSMYGTVEIPNNLSRMRASTHIVEYVEDLSDEDLKWVVRTMRSWIKSYVRAESTITNRNLTQDQLREFMTDGETPAERYWK